MAHRLGPAEFAAFGEPGYAKLAFNLRVDPHGATSAILSLETRVALTDPSSLRHFRRYWVIVGPFSGLIRQMALRLLAADLRQPARMPAGAAPPCRTAWWKVAISPRSVAADGLLVGCITGTKV